MSVELQVWVTDRGGRRELLVAPGALPAEAGLAHLARETMRVALEEYVAHGRVCRELETGERVIVRFGRTPGARYPAAYPGGPVLHPSVVVRPVGVHGVLAEVVLQAMRRFWRVDVDRYDAQNLQKWQAALPR